MQFLVLLQGIFPLLGSQPAVCFGGVIYILAGICEREASQVETEGGYREKVRCPGSPRAGYR